MLGFISKKRLLAIIGELKDSMDTSNVSGSKEYNWKCGNANAVNFILYRLGLENRGKKNG